MPVSQISRWIKQSRFRREPEPQTKLLKHGRDLPPFTDQPRGISQVRRRLEFLIDLIQAILGESFSLLQGRAAWGCWPVAFT